MKIPKEIKSKTNHKHITTFPSLESAFFYFKTNFPKFLSKDMGTREDYMINFLDNIKIRNTKKLYSLLRTLFLRFIDITEFKCYRCNPSCCNFKEDDKTIKEIGIYKEDYDLLTENNLDLNGYIKDCSKEMYEYYKHLEPNLEMSFHDFNRIDNLARETIGLYRRLNIIEIDGSLRCYYFDPKINGCSIHKYKPLVCLTYPIRIQNNFERFGIMKAEDCNWIMKELGKEGYDGLDEILEGHIEYWYYLIIIMLYLRSKNRFYIKNGKIIDNDKLTR